MRAAFDALGRRACGASRRRRGAASRPSSDLVGGARGAPSRRSPRSSRAASGRVPAAELARASSARCSPPRPARYALAAEAARAHFGVDAGVFAADERTLVVELVAPTPVLPRAHALLPDLPGAARVVEAAPPTTGSCPGASSATAPSCSRRGASAIASGSSGARPTGAATRVALASVDALPIENATTALNLYLTGEARLAAAPGYPADLGDDAARAARTTTAAPALVVYYYRVNCSAAAASTTRACARRSRSRSTARRSCATCCGSASSRRTHVVPPGLPGYERRPTPRSASTRRARARCSPRPAIPGGRGFPTLGILYNTREDPPARSPRCVADQLAPQPRHRGRAPTTRSGSPTRRATRAVDYDLARAGWIGDYARPEHLPRPLGHERRQQPDGLGRPALRRAGSAPRRDVEALRARARRGARGLREPARDARAPRRASARREARRGARPRAALRLQLLREAEAILVQRAVPGDPALLLRDERPGRAARRRLPRRARDPDGTRRPNLQDLHPLRGLWMPRMSGAARRCAARARCSPRRRSCPRARCASLGARVPRAARGRARAAPARRAGALALLASPLGGALRSRLAPSRVLRRVASCPVARAARRSRRRRSCTWRPATRSRRSGRGAAGGGGAARAVRRAARARSTFFGVYMRAPAGRREPRPVAQGAGPQRRRAARAGAPGEPRARLLALAARGRRSALALGVVAGLRPQLGSDHASMGLALVGISLPSFVIGARAHDRLRARARLAAGRGLGQLAAPRAAGAHARAAVRGVHRAARARGDARGACSRTSCARRARRACPSAPSCSKHALRGALLPVVSYLGPGRRRHPHRLVRGRDAVRRPRAWASGS